MVMPGLSCPAFRCLQAQTEQLKGDNERLKKEKGDKSDKMPAEAELQPKTLARRTRNMARLSIFPYLNQLKRVPSKKTNP